MAYGSTPRTRPGFSALERAADESVAAPNNAAAAASPLGPQVAEEAPPSKHPLYDDQDGEEEGTGHSQLMHDFGLAIQSLMQENPEGSKSIAKLIDEFKGSGFDYEGETKKLRERISKRETPKRPNWVAAGIGSWAGGQPVRARFQDLQDAATAAEQKKSSDMEALEKSLVSEHLEDLRAKGKSKDALLLGLLQGLAGQQKVETQQQGAMARTDKTIAARKELAERALGAAEARVRIAISGRKDIANQDRTAAQVLHLYESLLRQSEKDITGAVRPLYEADEAMDIALNSILPKVKTGVETVKTGNAPTPPSTETPPPAANKPRVSKFEQWKAQQGVQQNKR